VKQVGHEYLCEIGCAMLWLGAFCSRSFCKTDANVLGGGTVLSICRLTSGR
jgi:hypothetical protein